MEISTEVFSRGLALTAKVRMMYKYIVTSVCKVIRYVFSTMHKLQTLTRLQNEKNTVNFQSVLS